MIRVGVIGIGSIAKGVHIPGIVKSPDMELTAICTRTVQTLREVGAQYGIDEAHQFTDYRELIACPEVDAVSICGPNESHVEMAALAAEYGKPYILEKPVANTYEEARRLLEVTEKTGVKSMIAFSYRYKPAARYAKKLVAEGVIGRIYHVNMQYSQAWGLPAYERPLVWRFQKAMAGSGALGDLGCHALDLVHFVTGLAYTKVAAHLRTFVKERKIPGTEEMGPVDVDDGANMLLEFENGGMAEFTITRFAFGRGNYQRMEIYGEKGSLVYTLDQDQENGEVWLNDTPRGGAYRKLPVPAEMKLDQMQAFAEIVKGTEDGWSATAADGAANQKAVDAVIKAADEQIWVSL